MRIKSDVEFVKRECEGIWMSEMADYCGQEVISYNVDRDGDYCCIFSDGHNWAFPSSCLTEDAILEKGEKYTVNGSTDYFEFIEESENFAIFEGGIALKKDGNEFVEVAPEPRFLNEEWEVRVSKREGTVDVLCGGFYVAEITKDGLRTVARLPANIGFALDKRRAVKVVK